MCKDVDPTPDAQSELKRLLTKLKNAAKVESCLSRNLGTWGSEHVFLSECSKVDYIEFLLDTFHHADSFVQEEERIAGERGDSGCLLL